MNGDAKVVFIFSVASLVGIWIGGLLLWILPPPNEITWWSIPWLCTVVAVVILAAIITIEVLIKAHNRWRNRK